MLPTSDPVLLAPRMARRRMAEIVESIRRGESFVLIGGDGTGPELGRLVASAELMTPATMAQIVRPSSGLISVALPDHEADRLGLPEMVPGRAGESSTYGVTVDCRLGTTTGISAADRARTAVRLSDPGASREDFNTPGHVHVVRVHDVDSTADISAASAALELMRVAGMRPAAVLAELVTDDCIHLASGPEVTSFAEEHGLCLLRVDELTAAVPRLGFARVVARRPVRLHGSTFELVAMRERISGIEHAVLMKGRVGSTAVEVYTGRSCLFGDLAGSELCSCRSELRAAIERVACAPAGVIVIVGTRPQTGSFRCVAGDDGGGVIPDILAAIGLVAAGGVSDRLGATA